MFFSVLRTKSKFLPGLSKGRKSERLPPVISCSVFVQWQGAESAVGTGVGGASRADFSEDCSLQGVGWGRR